MNSNFTIITTETMDNILTEIDLDLFKEYKTINNYNLVITGSVGVGKSTMCQIIYKILSILYDNIKIYPEYINWLFKDSHLNTDIALGRIMLDSKLNGTISAVSFQNFVIDIWDNLLTNNNFKSKSNINILERLPEDAIYCFSKECRNNNEMTQNEYESILEKYNNLIQKHDLIETKNCELIIINNEKELVVTVREILNIIINDLNQGITNRIIGLKVSEDEYIKRIQKRGRSCEVDTIALDIYRHYNKYYSEYYSEFTNKREIISQEINQNSNKNHIKNITIRNKTYNFKEETYKLTNTDYFTIDCTKFDFEGNFVNETLLKTIKGHINNEDFNYESLNKDLRLKTWLEVKKNIKTINECSLKINKERFFNIVEETDGVDTPSVSVINLNTIMNDNYQIDINKLLETCIIPTTNKQTKFEYIPIYYYNGSNRRTDTTLLAEFNIVINILINKFPSFNNQLLTLGKLEMGNNLLNDKNIEETLKFKNNELLAKLNKIKEENLKLKLNLDETNQKLNNTELLLKEIREEREISELRHKETMEQLRKEAEDNEQKFILQIQQMKTQTARIMNGIKNDSKINLDDAIDKPFTDDKKEILRLYINKEDLSSHDKIIIKVNRCQLKYLKKLNLNELQLGTLLNTPNAIVTLNKFIKTSTIEITRLSSNKLEIKIDDLELFLEEFKIFVTNSQNLNEIEIIPEEVNKEIDYILLKYENLTKHLYFLEGDYRALTFNKTINKLQYYIKSADRTVTINNIQNTLQNKTCKIDGIEKSKVNTIRLINDKYEITFK